MRLFEIIKNNKIYTVLFVFIVLVNLAAFMVSVSDKKEAQNASPVKEEAVQEEDKKPRIKTVLTKEEMQEQKEKIEVLMKENPGLYLFIFFFELLVLFVIFLGFIFDGYFIARWFMKNPPDIHLLDRPDAAWTMGDVVRVVLIFVSSGYVFAILQGPFLKYVPILKNQNFSMVFNTGIINIGAVAVIIFFVVKKYGQTIKALGLSFKKVMSAVLIGITGYITAIPFLFIIMLLTLLIIRLISYQPPVQPIVEVFMEEKETSVLGVSVLFAAICGPIAEEIFFRGFMYSAFKKRMGVILAILVTSVLFSLLHTHIVGFMPIMVLGILLAYLYEKTGSIIPSITVHVIHNVGTVFMVFIAKYFNS